MSGLNVVGTFIYTRDMIRGFGHNINILSPSLLAGVRWYPLESRRFLQLGLDLGPSWLVFQSNIPGISDRSAVGLGVNTTVAIDFNHRLNGSHFLFGVNVLYSYINGGSVITPGVFTRIVFKRTRNAGDDFNFGDASTAAGIVWPLFGAVATWIGFNMLPSSNRS